MEEAVKQRIEEMVQKNKVFLFMKGTPQQPMCGFSAGVVNALNSVGAQFDSFNVLSDNSIREGVKEYANWPTIPQLYVNKEFLGGHDIVMQMLQSGDLAKEIGK